jgi:hypothetical protein
VLGVATLLVLLPGLSGETIGGGTVANPAVGPAPAHAIGGTGFTLVRNWNFGTSESSTVKSYSELNTHFNYHNMNGVTGPQIGYGAEAVAPSYATAVAGQPIENVNTAGPVREFFTDSLRTYVLPLDGATTVSPSAHNAGSGSFFAKWSLPAGGSVLGQDILWETRVRYVPPKQFWFSIWTAGKQWAAGGGPEIDLIESFDYEWNGTSANPNGEIWHSAVSKNKEVSYASWPAGMSSVGITNYDASQYHIWSVLIRTDNTCRVFVDGIEVQRGTFPWRRGGVDSGIPTDLHFLFDATWGYTGDERMNKSMASSVFAGKYFEWDYSRVYLRGAAAIPLVDNENATLLPDASAWTSSTAVGEFRYLGADYLHDGNSGKGAKSVRWTPTIPEAGAYEVYAMWHGTTGGTRATNAPYTITHALGSDNVVKDQNTPVVSWGTSASAWNLLGQYTFNAGTAGSVLLSNAGTTNYVIADAVLVTPVPPLEVFVDNAEATLLPNGTAWPAGSGTTGQHYKTGYRSDGNAGKGTKTVRWTPNLPEAGTYKVYAMWNNTNDTGRATNVPYAITHAGGTSNVVKNQNLGGGQWNLLGTYTFNAGTGGNVLVSTTGTTGHVIADAVRFVKQSGTPALLSDDFEDGIADGWTPNLPAQWTVATDAGNKCYKFDAAWPNNGGVSTAGSASWTNYTLMADVKVPVLPDWTETCFYVRYVDSDNYYRLLVEARGGYRRYQLQKRVGGGTVANLGSSVTVTFAANTWYVVSLAVNGNMLTAYLDDVVILQQTDSSLASGKIAVGSNSQDPLFDNILVR